MLKKLTAGRLALLGGIAIGGIALHRHEPINALWIVTAARVRLRARLPLLRGLDRRAGAHGRSDAARPPPSG